MGILQQNFQADSPGTPCIKVVGIGGGGSNAVSRMFREPIPGVEYYVVNTDVQALSRSEVPNRIAIGEKLTRGMGVGGNPDLGRQAAEESRDDLAEAIRGADMVFLAAGMGGGTGTGALPIVAEVCKELGALTVAVITRPFSFEGAKRRRIAEDGIHRLKDKVDALIAIPNDRLRMVVSDQKLTMNNAFRMADEVLRQGVQAIAELVTIPGEINLDFADVKAVLTGNGPAWLGIGRAKGERRAEEAARAAASCPLLDYTMDGAKGILFNITGGDNLTLAEVHQAAEHISQNADPEAAIFFGMVQDSKMEDEVKITVIATGFPGEGVVSQKMDEFESMVTGGKLPDLDLPPFLRERTPAAAYAPGRQRRPTNGYR
ncbi:MAG: cell division protein FtsZ [Dehalococcoidia bacterium]